MTDNQKKIVKDSIILVAILIVGIFLGRGTKHVDTSGVEKQIADKDTIIHLLTKEREAVNNNINLLEDINEQLQIKDSLLTEKYKSYQTIDKLLNEKLQVIRTTINRVANNNDSLRAIIHGL